MLYDSFIHLLIHPSTHLSIYSPLVSSSIHPSFIHPSIIHPSIIHPSIHLSFIHLSSIHPPIHPFIIHPSIIRPSTYPSIHPSFIHLSSIHLHRGWTSRRLVDCRWMGSCGTKWGRRRRISWRRWDGTGWMKER